MELFPFLWNVGRGGAFLHPVAIVKNSMRGWMSMLSEVPGGLHEPPPPPEGTGHPRFGVGPVV